MDFDGMDELRDIYRQELGPRIVSLEASLGALRRNGPDAEKTIRKLAHKLHGSGGTYGFHDISDAAEILEHATLADIPAAARSLLDVLRNVAAGGGPSTEQKMSILVIEDDPDISTLLKTVLSSAECEVVVAETGGDALRIANEKKISLIVLDLVLPDMDGRVLLRRIQERSAGAAISAMIISALGDKATAIQCYDLGVETYFTKPIDPDIVSAAVKGRLARIRKTEEMTTRDLLTGLTNRAGAADVFTRMRSLATRTGRPLAMGIVDIDRFKSINDTHGHAMGDEVLRHTAQFVKKSLRSSDFIARWGGEEFIVILPNTTAEEGVLTLNRIRKAMQNELFITPKGEKFSVSFSGGVTEVRRDARLEESVSEADRFLYLAKASGRDRVACEKDELPTTRTPILLAEDDVIIASIVRTHLGREGFDVRHIDNGLKALETAEKMNVSLFIVDILMPGMDGLELVKRLRAIPAFRATPILILTSLGSEEDIVRGLESGADEYVVKPFSMLELIARIRRLLQRAAV